MFDLILTILLLPSWAVSFTMLALYNLHIFQLNSYKPHEQRAWLKKNFLPAFVGRSLGVLLTPWFILFCGKAGMVLSILLFALTAYLGRPRKAKKPLVYTARVKRMLVSFGLSGPADRRPRPPHPDGDCRPAADPAGAGDCPSRRPLFCRLLHPRRQFCQPPG